MIQKLLIKKLNLKPKSTKWNNWTSGIFQKNRLNLKATHLEWNHLNRTLSSLAMRHRLPVLFNRFKNSRTGPDTRDILRTRSSPNITHTSIFKYVHIYINRERNLREEIRDEETSEEEEKAAAEEEDSG